MITDEQGVIRFVCCTAAYSWNAFHSSNGYEWDQINDNADSKDDE